VTGNDAKPKSISSVDGNATRRASVDKDQIVSTLETLLMHLDRPENRAIKNLREFVVDAKERASKNDIDTSQLATSLRAIADATSYVTSLSGTYRALAQFADAFGRIDALKAYGSAPVD
jgi:hypothetical protein